jgi:GxxExxY protein
MFADNEPRRRGDTEVNLLEGNENDITESIIGCAIDVHKALGPGLLETVYENALCIELAENGITFQRQVAVPLYYRGHLISEHRPDLVVAERVVVGVKCVEHVLPIHKAQVLTYLRVLNLHTGLVLNFKTEVMRQGIKRVRL